MTCQSISARLETTEGHVFARRRCEQLLGGVLLSLNRVQREAVIVCVEAFAAERAETKTSGRGELLK